MDKVLKNAYLGYDSDLDDEEEIDNKNDEFDTIPNSPGCSPNHFNWNHKLLVGSGSAGASQLLQSVVTNSNNIHSPSCSPTNVPLPSNISAASSITAPSFSPITPLAYLNSLSVTTTPMHDPLTPKPHQTLPDACSVGHESLPDAIQTVTIEQNIRQPSPMPAMSPETKKVFDILNKSEFFENSDDSVRDPDFYPENEDDDNSSATSYCINITEALIHDVQSNSNRFDNRFDENSPPNILPNVVNQNSITCIKNFVCSDEKTRNREERYRNDSEIECYTLDINTNDKGDIDNIKDNTLQLDDVNDAEHIKEGESNDNHFSTVGRPKRGRKHKMLTSRKDLKEKKYCNLPYYNRKNKKIDSKTFIDYKCNCKTKCSELVSREAREIEFNKYTTLGSFSAQLMYLVSCVEEHVKRRQYLIQNNTKNKKREYSRIYKLCGIKVCRDMFINTLQVSTQKVNTSLTKMRSGEIIKDKRGEASGGWNKISDESFEMVINLINMLPKYESHYRRDNTDAMYLASEMTLPKMYELYQDKFKSMPDVDNTKLCSFSTFKRIFYKKFNLRFKTLKKDTCNKCDAYAISINTSDQDEKILKEREHKKHLDLAEGLQAQMKADFEKARLERNVECLTFDLEKTLPLPRIPTNVVFYKRQLWVYNCGIHSASNDRGHCFVWVEGEAGRGAQEVGSCLLNYINKELPDYTEELILWSDSCGGQNRNIKITLLMKAALHSHPSLKSISMKFLEPGHSFLPNDSDFAKIETRLKQHQRIYVVEDYIDIMKKCKKVNPLKVIRMKTDDFVSCKMLEKQIVNRKTFINKNKVSWLATKELLLKKEKEYSIFMRSGLNGEFQELDISKKRNQVVLNFNLDSLIPLWPQGKEISQAKVDDIKSLMHLIPADCHDFYNTIKGNINIVDDIDGIDRPDFEIELQV